MSPVAGAAFVAAAGDRAHPAAHRARPQPPGDHVGAARCVGAGRAERPVPVGRPDRHRRPSRRRGRERPRRARRGRGWPSAARRRDDARSGTEIDDPPRYLIGVADMPLADPYDPARLEAKLDAGADVVWTQIAYDVEALVGLGRHDPRPRAPRAGEGAGRGRAAPQREGRPVHGREAAGRARPAADHRGLERAGDDAEAVGIGLTIDVVRGDRGDRRRLGCAPDGHGSRRRWCARSWSGQACSRVPRAGCERPADPRRPCGHGGPTSAVGRSGGGGGRSDHLGRRRRRGAAARARHRGHRRRWRHRAAGVHRLAQPRAAGLEPRRGRPVRRRDPRRGEGAGSGARRRPSGPRMDRRGGVQLLGDARRAHADRTRISPASPGAVRRSCSPTTRTTSWLNAEAMEAFGITREAPLRSPGATSARTRGPASRPASSGTSR